MVDLFKDSDLKSLRKVGSKTLVNDFIKRGKDQGEVNISSTGRDTNTVYVALGLYLKRHPALGLQVKTMNDKVYLLKIDGAENVGESPDA